MPGRNAKPAGLHVLEGNPNRRTKAELKARIDNEIRLGDKKFLCPDFVKSNVVAFKKWNEIVELYNDINVDFVTNADTGTLARYCITFSEYLDLIQHREMVNSADSLTLSEQNQFMSAAQEQYGDKVAATLWKKVDYLLSIGGLLQVDKAINAKLTALNQLEDRLFLNPLAKVKNVPKKAKEEIENKSSKQMFGE